MSLTPFLLPADEFLAVFFFGCSTSQTCSEQQKAAGRPVTVLLESPSQTPTATKQRSITA